MRKSHSTNAGITLQQRKSATLRLCLGQAQICGATVTLVFVLSTGASTLTFWAASITALLTLASLLLFRSRWRITR